MLLMAEILPHLGCMKPYKQWDKLPTSTGVLAGFQNHQHYPRNDVTFSEFHDLDVSLDDEHPKVVINNGRWTPFLGWSLLPPLQVVVK